MAASYKSCSLHIIWLVLILGAAYPLSLGPVLWYYRHPAGDGFSKPTQRILNTVYAPLEAVFIHVPQTRKLFDAYCVWLWTQWGDQKAPVSSFAHRK